MGGRANTRLLSLKNKDSLGLSVVGRPTFDFSILPYSPTQLTQKSAGDLHNIDLVREETLSVCLDYKHMGLGGINSWGAQPLEKYRIPVKKYSFGFSFMPIN